MTLLDVICAIHNMTHVAHLLHLCMAACSVKGAHSCVLHHSRQQGHYSLSVTKCMRMPQCITIVSGFNLLEGVGGKLLPQTLKLPPQIFPSCNTK